MSSNKRRRKSSDNKGNSPESRRNNKRGKGSGNPQSRDPHHQREQTRYEQPIASREFILSTLRAEPGPVDFEALANHLELEGNDVAMEALRRRVAAMIRDGQLIQNRRRGLIPVDDDNLLAGRITAHPDGFGFVVVDDSKKDIYLNGKQMRQVLHGDRVVVCVTGTDHKGRREGRIVDVVERANKSLVGRLAIDFGTAVVSPDNKRIHQDLLIAPGEIGDARDGDMVVAEIIEQPTRRHQPVGRIVEVLGQHLRPGMEIDVALHSHGIPVQWPDAVLEQAAAFSTDVDQAAAKGRKDVRKVPLVTIDGIDARDFDDAVWCEAVDGGWRLLVAIADVAHYVQADSPLDEEAVSRGTSVYFPGRVVPMLPEVLSNGLCSLNPKVDRLCMICELTLDGSGEVKKTRFHNGIMRSHARLTYDQVNEMLTDRKSSLIKRHKPLMPVIQELHKLYKVLSAKRKERGAIEFDSKETHIIFDDNKKIREIVPIERNDAHKLIEECMILANIQAAAFLQEKKIPALYRVHNGPKADRLDDLRAFLALRSLSLGGGDSPSAVDYAVLADAIAERTDRSVIQTVMLRSMQQAVYQPVNEGHFGLALEEYAHFTSPIRRYPDLLVHRALKHAIDRGKPSDYRYSTDTMASLGESCSVTERRAEEASREVVAWLKCEYMQDHVGSDFDGVISAVTAFGLFVELTGIHVEGLIHVTGLSRDYYRFDQAAQAMIGERSGRQYRLGDPIRVKVAAVNLEERKIDFTEVESGFEVHRGTAKHKHVSKKRTSKETADALHATSAVGKTVSAEQRRQQKRKLKQQRRDQKRADRKAAKLAQQVLDNAAVELVDQAASPQHALGVMAAVDSAESVSDTGKPLEKLHKESPVVDELSESAAGGKRVGGSGKGKVAGEKKRVKKASAKKRAQTTRVSKVTAKKQADEKRVAKISAKKQAKKKNVAKVSAKKKQVAKVISKKQAKKKPVAKVRAKTLADKKDVAKVSAKKKRVTNVSPKKLAKKKHVAKVSAKRLAQEKRDTSVTLKKTASKKRTGTISAKKQASKKRAVDLRTKKQASKMRPANASTKTSSSLKRTDGMLLSKKKSQGRAKKKPVGKSQTSKKASAKKRGV